jgi:hypothetical protein
MDSELQGALDECRKRSQEAFESAFDAIVACEEVVKVQSRAVASALSQLSERGFENNELFIQLKSTSISSLDHLNSVIAKQRGLLEFHRTRSSAFAVTLFGRTMAGKSTLKEILTEGDGSSIGLGLQRTTRDVRRYPWKGLEVVDVPGVAAFEGRDDEEVAHKAACEGDLILFLMNDSGPQSAEGLHLARVKELGKPIIGICNIREGLEEEDLVQPTRLRRALRNIDERFEQARLDALVEQLHVFADPHAPGIQIEFTHAHLRSEYLGKKLGVPELRQASRFSDIEGRLISIVQEQGPFIRSASFLAGTAAQLNGLVRSLFDASRECVQAEQKLRGRSSNARAWAAEFLDEADGVIDDGVSTLFEGLRAQIPTFVQQHVEDTDVGTSWAALIHRARIHEELEATQIRVLSILAEKQTELGRDERVKRQGVSIAGTVPVRHAVITDWQRVGKWVGALIAAGAPLMPPLAKLGGIVHALSDWCLDSRATKVTQAESALTQRLQAHLEIQERRAKAALKNWLVEDVSKQQVRDLAEDVAAAKAVFTTMAGVYRKLGGSLAASANDLSLRLVGQAFQQCGAGRFFDGVSRCAYTPNAAVLLLRPGMSLPLSLPEALRDTLQTSVRVCEDTKEVSSTAVQLLRGWCRSDELRIDNDGLHLEVERRDKGFEERILLIEQLLGLPVFIQEKE